VAADAGNQNQTTDEEFSFVMTPTQEKLRPTEGKHQTSTDWFEPIPPDVETGSE
jgi:hypothetical protein